MEVGPLDMGLTTTLVSVDEGVVRLFVFLLLLLLVFAPINGYSISSLFWKTKQFDLRSSVSDFFLSNSPPIDLPREYLLLFLEANSKLIWAKTIKSTQVKHMIDLPQFHKETKRTEHFYAQSSTLLTRILHYKPRSPRT